LPAGAPSFLLVLPHVPLDWVDDPQERQPHRPEMILAVYDLAKRSAPVHTGIVVAFLRMSLSLQSDIRE
jgi:hypothetical protein